MTAINIINRFRFAIASLVAPFPITRIVDFPVRFSESGIWESEMYGDEDIEEEDEEFDPCYYMCNIDPMVIVPPVVTYQGNDYRIIESPYLEENTFCSIAECNGKDYYVEWECFTNPFRTCDGESPCDWKNPSLVSVI